MRIKKNNTSLSDLKIVSNLIQDRKFVIRGMLWFVGLMIILAIFLAILLYGAFMHRVDRVSGNKPILVKAAELDFSFLTDVFRKQTEVFDRVELNIEPKHWTQLQNLGQRIFKEGKVEGVLDDESYPAELIFNGKSHPMQIGLTGNMAMYFGDPAKWSFRINASEENNVEDMDSFNLLFPVAGDYKTDWLNNGLMVDRGVKVIKEDFVWLDVNGKSNGLYYLQERFEKKVARDYGLANGIFFNLDEDLRIHQEDQLLRMTTTAAQVDLLKRRWMDFQNGKLPLSEFFDLEKMATYFAVLDLLNHKPLPGQNLSFYFDPLSERVEPVARELSHLNAGDPFNFSYFLEKNNKNDQQRQGPAADAAIQAFAENMEFKRFYVREAAAICEKQFLSEFLFRHKDKMGVLFDGSSKTWIEDPSIEALYGNAKLLRYVIFPNEPETMAWFGQKEENRLQVQVQNIQDLPLKVLYLSYRDSILFYPEESIILKAKSEQLQTFDFRIPPAFVWVDSLLPELILHYNLHGLQTGRRSALVYPWSYQDRLSYPLNPASREADYQNLEFIEEGRAGILVISAGNWTLSKDLIIPPNRQLNIEPGTKLDLVNHAKIISYSPVFSLGQEGNPVTIFSSDSTGEGLIVIRAQKRSYVSRTNFDRLSCPVDGGWQLSGAVTFYESPVSISLCTLSNNLNGDDFLNIVRTDFTLDQTQFKNIKADALDCDFCTGTVTNSSFVQIGNDGIDVSGTELEVSNVQMTFIGDKGLSAGEHSKMTAKWVQIRNAEIAITSKDHSEVFLADTQISDSKIGIALFQKKSEFGPAYLTAERTTMHQTEFPYLVEENCFLMLEGEAKTANRDNIKEILYGVEFGKSSK